MTKSFDEWRNEQRNKVDGYTERDAYEAGQQSKQAEVDDLQKRIDLALDVIYKEKSAVECDKYIGVDADLIIGIGYDLHKILKGDSHEP